MKSVTWEDFMSTREFWSIKESAMVGKVKNEWINGN